MKIFPISTVKRQIGPENCCRNWSFNCNPAELRAHKNMQDQAF